MTKGARDPNVEHDIELMNFPSSKADFRLTIPWPGIGRSRGPHRSVTFFGPTSEEDAPGLLRIGEETLVSQDKRRPQP